MERRLVLVCQEMSGCILTEVNLAAYKLQPCSSKTQALRTMTTTNRGRWLLDRIAGIVRIDLPPDHASV